MDAIPWVIGVLFTLVGGAVAAAAVSSVRAHGRRARSWRRDRATVVGYEWRGSVQHWVMERTDPRGRTHRTVSELGVSGGTLRSFPFDVDVLVDPADESSFVLADGCRSGSGGLVLGVGGGLFLLAGVATLTVLVLT